MIIDSHQHVFWHGKNDDGLIADMDEQKIDLAWLLSWSMSPMDDDGNYHAVLDPRSVRDDGTHGGLLLDVLVRVRDRYPDRFVLGYCPNPVIGRPSDLLKAAHEIHGARVCGEWKHRVPFDDPRCLELFLTAGKLNCPVVLHLDVPYLSNEKGEKVYQPRWYGGTVENLERALAFCDQTIFIGHAPGFWREISGDADRDPALYPTGPVAPGGKLYKLFDKYPNLYADLSANSAIKALQRDPANARDFLTRYADRLLFGRDNYGGALQEFLLPLHLDDSVMRKILFENANRLVPTTPNNSTK